MGHHAVSFTLSTYDHALPLPGVQEEATKLGSYKAGRRAACWATPIKN